MTILNDSQINTRCKPGNFFTYQIRHTDPDIGPLTKTFVDGQSAFARLLSLGVDITSAHLAAKIREAKSKLTLNVFDDAAMRSQKEVAIWLDTVMDNDVRLAISHGERPPMISPFVPSQITKDQYGQKVISYGLSSYGYDLRCSREFKIFTNAYSGRLDAKSPDPSSCLSHTGDFCIVPPGGLVLTNTVEKFHIPRDIMTVVLGKSTYARLGLVCNTTPAEPGWTGYLTLEFSNTSPLPIKLYAGEGCAQMLFFEGEYDATINYADREGKYMDQENQPVHARMK